MPGLAPRPGTPARPYKGRLTDTARWASLNARAGDVFVCTPTKCGTTWTQSMVTMLLAGTADLPDRLNTLSPWYDAALPGALAAHSELTAITATLDAQTRRRCIKTHTPADGIPIHDGPAYIAVYRHPVDVFFSIRHHLGNTAGMDPDHPFLGAPGPAFRGWVDQPYDALNCDRDSLESITAHFLSYVRATPVPNLLVLHYSDMKRDHPGTLDRIAAHLGIALPAPLRSAILTATGFEAMKASASRYAPMGGTGFFQSESAFFASGRSGEDRAQLTDDDLAPYRTRLASLLPQADARWLEEGGPLPA